MKRLWLTASVLAQVLAGLAVWVKLLSNQPQAQLPHALLASLQAQVASSSLPLRLHLYVLSDEEPAAGVSLSWSGAALRALGRQLGLKEGEEQLSSTVEGPDGQCHGDAGDCLGLWALVRQAWPGPDGPASFDDALAVRLHQHGPACQAGTFTLLVMPGGQAAAGHLPFGGQATVILGRHRHGWLPLADRNAQTPPERIEPALRSLIRCLRAARRSPAAPLPAITHVSLLLVDAHARLDLQQPWQPQQLSERLGLAQLGQRMLGLTDLRVSSKVVRASRPPRAGAMAALPRWSAAARAHCVAADELVHTVDISSAGAHSSDDSRILGIALIVPPTQHSPLLLLAPDGQPLPNNAFGLPSWGAIVGVNMPLHARHLEPQQLAGQLAPVAAWQLRRHLGLPHPGEAGEQVAYASAALLVDWELDGLQQMQYAANCATALSLLQQLQASRLAAPQMKPGQVRQQVQAAVEALQRAAQLASNGEGAQAAAAARSAREAAEAAARNPAALEQLNMPPSHQVGVFAPLLFPASVPLIQGLLAELKQWWLKRGAMRV